MKQFAIQNGDLVLGPGGYATVQGGSKARQDLSHAIIEPVGTDRFHPRWGSNLKAMIGQVTSPEMSSFIEAECIRVVRNYIVSRVSMMQEDVQSGLRPQVGAAEVIQSVSSVKVRQAADKYFVKIELRTLSGDSVLIATSLEQ